jgi:cytidyltransferase-like protein
VRYVGSIGVVSEPFERGLLPTLENPPESGAVRAWVVDEMDDNEDRRSFCLSQGLEYFLITKADTMGFPARQYQPQADQSGNKKVLVTGCYDWVHSGHVRFFEEVSGLGDLFVVVGNDANVNFLKGAGHPMFSQDERRYMVQSIRYVKQALITSGTGWMDAEPEIDLVKPDYYAVNEDGDKPEKRLFCQEHGITYVVLTRTPKKGLPRRNSTDLRGY